MKRIFLLLLCLGATGFAQINPNDSIVVDSISNESIELGGLSIVKKLPVTATRLGKEAINERNLGQDIPTLLSHSVSAVTTSDAGAGIGYSSLRIRGVSQQQINVTLNGIQLNDGESQGPFWVNLPDLASSSSSIVIQRGVGTTTNGTAAFGASINIETGAPSSVPFFEAATSWGSFNTGKYTIQGGTGAILNGKVRMDLRLSSIDSDGYIDRATSDLKSYDFNLQYDVNEKTSFRFQNLFGREITYQAWEGIDGETLRTNRRFNPAGAIYNEDGTIDYYDNQVDNYRQNHYFLTWNQQYGNNWKSTATLHYTKGKGYYESYRFDDRINRYELDDYNFDFERTDLIRRKWLNNDFYGIALGLENQHLGDLKLFFGLSANRYDGDHYGNILWMKDFNWEEPNYKYYNNNAVKDQASAFAKALYTTGKFDFFGDLQYRYVGYKTKYLPGGENEDEGFTPFEDEFHFINPKAGINFNVNTLNTIYATYGLSQREPVRSDYEFIADNPKAETLHDFEFGYKKTGDFSFNINAFYMYYLNQLVLTGELNDVGTPKRVNSGKSFRAGIELDANWQIIRNRLFLFGNVAYSQNKNKNFIEEAYNENWELEPIEHGETDIAFSPNWVSSFGIEVHPIKNIAINVINKYVGEQYLSNTEPADGILDAYFTTDILLRFSPKFKGIKNLEFSFLINNVFDEEFVNNGYYYDGGYYYPQAGINVLGGVRIRL